MNIQLANSKLKCLVSNCDYEIINKYKWYLDFEGYVTAWINKKKIKLHRSY